MMDPTALSDGYKRRLALAVQLMRQPALLLLDEPLAGAHALCRPPVTAAFCPWRVCAAQAACVRTPRCVRTRMRRAAAQMRVDGAGLDWRARKELVALLSRLKQQCSVLVISHDLRELAPITDAVWHMLVGGRLEYAGTVAPSSTLLGNAIDVLA